MIACYAFVATGTIANYTRNVLCNECRHLLIVTIRRTYFDKALQVRVWFARLRSSTSPREGWFSAR